MFDEPTFSYSFCLSKFRQTCTILETFVLGGSALSLNYEQLQSQVSDLGRRAVIRDRRLRELRTRVRDLFGHYAQEADHLRKKVDRAAQAAPTLRCARPHGNDLTSAYQAPSLPDQVTVLAADGSQIHPDPHDAVQYYVVNIGGIWLALDQTGPPHTLVETRLSYEDEVYTPHGLVSRGQVGLERDVAERTYLSDWARSIFDGSGNGPLVTLTDGPLELWGSHEIRGERSSSYRDGLKRYLDALGDLQHMGTITAGYVDKPRANYVVKLMEVATIPDDELDQVTQHQPFQGINDTDLFRGVLDPGERSAIFGIQSHASKDYPNEMALHFFYLNVGSAEKPWLTRVEVPAWIAVDQDQLDILHGVLLHQCHMMGGVGYPYLLHRAHEVALVQREEQEMLTKMIMRERRKRGLSTGQISHKKYYKDRAGRKRYRR